MESISQMWISIVLVLVILGVIAFLLRKSKRLNNFNSDMKIIGRVAVGPRSYLAKVKVNNKTILLGITPQNISYLCNLSDKSHENVSLSTTDRRENP